MIWATKKVIFNCEKWSTFLRSKGWRYVSDNTFCAGRLSVIGDGCAPLSPQKRTWPNTSKQQKHTGSTRRPAKLWVLWCRLLVPLSKSFHFYICHQKQTHTKLICREAKRTTTDLTPRMKSSRRGASIGVGATFHIFNFWKVNLEK